jgi:MFS transporter, DHA1 family, inner membrane transport protein
MDAEFIARMETPNDAPRGRDWALVLMLAAVQFTSIVDFMVVMPLGPQLIRKLDLSAFQFGLIVSSYSISAGIAGLLASSIMDRFGRKTAFLSLYAGFLVGTLFCGLARQYSALLAARVLTGCFGGILGGLALTIVADVFPEKRRGQATGVLMSAFAVASAVGVPAGLSIGTKWGWNVPFLVLAGLGSFVFFAAFSIMPPLRDHVHDGAHAHPLSRIVDTFRDWQNLIAFSLTAAVMFGAFSVIPYISLSLVSNVGVLEENLWMVFVTGGILSVFGAPAIGMLADRFGKLAVYRNVACVSACLILVVTNLPRVHLALAIGTVGLLMLSNAGRMVAALAMVTASVEPRVRGGVMSANSAVQHMSSGLGAYIGGMILRETADKHLVHFDRVGLMSVTATALSLWLAGMVRPAQAKSAAKGDLDSTGRTLEELPLEQE